MANSNATKFPANVIGPQIKRLRRTRGWSQAKLAERLQLNGLDFGRDVIARIECRTHCVRDKEILFIAQTFEVEIARLFLNTEQHLPPSFNQS